ncbi:UPF0149 family protein [Legionella adelaidensis]|nr:YecA family protein [Legionella adelaidensis]
MSNIIPEHLPNYEEFLTHIDGLDLPYSGSEVHGVMCGYLCTGASNEGENYIRALVNNTKNSTKKEALMALFSVYAISYQQLINFDFEFELLLPDEGYPLVARAQAFSEWCQGFTQGVALSGFTASQLSEEEAVEALRHISEFAELDYESLDVSEDDEKALLEVSEYTRLAVLQIFNDIKNTLTPNSENSH